MMSELHLLDRLAVSNIAWPKSEDELMYPFLAQKKIKFLEISPTRIWDDPFEVTAKDVVQLRDQLMGYGIQAVAMQSLFYKYPELRIYQRQEDYDFGVRYMIKLIQIANELGVKALVFGSPKQRQVSSQNPDQAEGRAISFFNIVGESAQKYRVMICLEPVSTDFGTNFLTSLEDTARFVSRVNNPGIGINLDIGQMTSAKESIKLIDTSLVKKIGHIHISSPDLSATHIDKKRTILTLRQVVQLGYKHFFSIELLSSNNLAKTNIEQTLKLLPENITF